MMGYPTLNIPPPRNHPAPYGESGDPHIPPTRSAQIIASKYLPIDEPAPRFLRDQININDIEGTKSKPLYKGLAKDILNARDIEGTAPKFERLKPKPYDLMDYSDVSSKRQRLPTNRALMGGQYGGGN